jgi:Immunity protein Imm1
MRKRVYFGEFDGRGWPLPEQLQRYFLAPHGQRWTFEGGNDSWGLTAEGVDGTEHLEANKGRIDVDLDMWGHPDLGVLLIYSKWGGGLKQTYSSKGDLRRLREWVRSLHDTPLPVGLFIPFEQAWKAVKEFIETDGQLPRGIEWVANRDLPPNTFPDP